MPATDALRIFPLMLIRRAGLPGRWLEALSIDWQPYDDALADRREELRSASEELQRAFDRALVRAEPESAARTLLYNARKEFFHTRRLRPSTLDRLRALPPEYAVATAGVAAAQQAVESGERALREAWQNALTDNYRVVQRAAAEPALQRGLLFASHDLLRRLPGFVRNPVEQWTKKDRQTALSAANYLTRAAVKTSPLSHFTTVGLWRAERARDADDRLPFDDAKSAVVPSAALLPLLYGMLLREPAFYNALQIKLNASITGPAPVYTWLYSDGEHEAIQTLDGDEALDAVVAVLLESGRQTAFPALLDAVCRACDAEADEAEAYIRQLLDVGLLAWQWPETGLSAGWAGALQNWLGFLPARPAIVDTAALLQWLRTTARTLPYQAVEAAMEAQQAACEQVTALFNAHAPDLAPDVPAERLFFEDVERTTVPVVPPEALSRLARALAGAWTAAPEHRSGGARAAVLAFALGRLAPGQREPVLDFCRAFLSTENAGATSVWMPAFRGKIGALLQFFEENGQWKAVVNGLFPGGGKLFARWLHLFPADVREQLAGWFPADATPFPWHDWHNANFQPVLSDRTLAMPGGRVGSGPSTAFLLGNIDVEHRDGQIMLVDRPSGQRIVFTDLGLEAPENRPPVMQILAHLGMPFVSLEALLPGEPVWQTPLPGWSHRPRVELDHLVLARALWRAAPDGWGDPLPETESARYFHWRDVLRSAGVPRRFFARFAGEKPRYFDAHSPVLMLAFDKMLRGETRSLFLTEMLPAIREWAEEVVVEVEVQETPRY